METYNLQKMQELLHDFYYLTGIKICIYDSGENELCYYPEKLSAFCALLRGDKEMDGRCRQCDKRAFAECRRTHRQYVYTCHAGLLECISPIVCEKKIIGYIVIGQIKPPGKTDFSAIAHRLPTKYRERLAECFCALPDADIGKIDAAMRILDACTGYEYLKELVRSAERRIDLRIGGYIDDNLSGNLSVQQLCSRFRLSHSEIYALFREYFRTTPAEYIRERRLDKACRLLAGTSLPVGKIAAECGIPDYNYFSKIFRRTRGVSPRQYRKAAGKIPLQAAANFLPDGDTK